MAFPYNIVGARGIIGLQGVSGIQGTTGIQGVSGIQGTTGSPYEYTMKLYEREGFNMKYRTMYDINIMIKDMDDNIIRIELDAIKKLPLNEARKAWLEIFADVKVKRRKLKLEKIKSKIDANIES